MLSCFGADRVPSLYLKTKLTPSITQEFDARRIAAPDDYPIRADPSLQNTQCHGELSGRVGMHAV
eukprot:4598040-Pleurochrysis_carterae.AAC.3